MGLGRGTHIFVADGGLPERAGGVPGAPPGRGGALLARLDARHAHSTSRKGLTAEAVKALQSQGAVALEAVGARHARGFLRLLRRRPPHRVAVHLPRRRRGRGGARRPGPLLLLPPSSRRHPRRSKIKTKSPTVSSTPSHALPSFVCISNECEESTSYDARERGVLVSLPRFETCVAGTRLHPM